MIARGTFDVKVTPLPADTTGGPFDRLLLEKQFHGDLEGAGRGQMLGTRSAAVEGSGGYVALESVTGVLTGKRGSFVLQHKGTMRGGNFAIHVTVVPDSGTGELTGIAGIMTLIIDGSRHAWEFDYTLEQPDKDSPD